MRYPTLKWMSDNVLASALPWSYVLGEWRELLDEVQALNGPGMSEEWSDVTCCAALWAYEKGILPGWFPLLPGFGLYAARKFTARRAVWARIFDHHGIAFNKRYLVGGGNYAKSRKVIGALGLAGCSQVDLAWLRTENLCVE